MKFLKGLLVLVLVVSIVAVAKNAADKIQEPATGLVTPVEEVPVVTIEEVQEAMEVVPVEPMFTPMEFFKLKDLKKLGATKVVVADSLDPKGKGYLIDGDTYFQSKDGSLYVIHNGEVVFIK